MTSETDQKQPIATFFATRKITYSHDFGAKNAIATLREFKGCDCDGAPIIEAFSGGAGISLSQIVAAYLIDSLKLPLIGDITSEHFPPLVIVKNGVPMNSCRIYGNKELVVFMGDYKFGPEMGNAVTKALYDFANRHHSEELIVIKNIEKPVTEEDVSKPILDELKPPESKEELMALLKRSTEKRGDEKLWFTTNSECFADKMISLGHKPVQELLLQGISGAILAESCFNGIPVAALFSPSHELNKFFQIDARASLSILQCLAELLKNKVKIDVSSMDSNLKKIDDKLVEVIKEMATPTPGKVAKQLDYYL